MGWGVDRFKNPLRKGSIVTFASPGSSKNNLGAEFTVSKIMGEDVELINKKTKRKSFTSAGNIVRVL